jgi:hypothetical protein
MTQVVEPLPGKHKAKFKPQYLQGEKKLKSMAREFGIDL